MIDDTALYRTSAGVSAVFAARGSANDTALIAGIVGEDEYDLASLPRLSGWALDIGAHIGTVAIPLALDNPDLRVLAVEALPENVAVLEKSIAMNALTERVIVVPEAATDDATKAVEITYGWDWAINQPDNYIQANRYIGNMVGPNDSSTTISCPGVSLSALLRRYDISRVALLKIDCEGCEWAFLDSPDIGRVDRILGEYHDGTGIAGIRALLEPTHTVTHLSGTNVGHFAAVVR